MMKAITQNCRAMGTPIPVRTLSFVVMLLGTMLLGIDAAK